MQCKVLTILFRGGVYLLVKRGGFAAKNNAVGKTAGIIGKGAKIIGKIVKK